MNFGGTIRLNKFGVCIVTALLFLLIFYLTSNKTETDKKTVVSLKKLLIASIETAVKGGKEVIDVHEESNLNQRTKGKTKEGVDEPVTNADERSHCAMYYSLTHTFPDVKVISEEKSSESACRTRQTLDLDQNVLPNAKDLEDEEVPASDITIWIDPLDATKEFTESLLQYVTTMVCVAVKGEPIIGVIYSPFGDDPRATWGWVNKGASSEIKKKSVKNLDDNKSVIISRSHSGEVEKLVKSALGDNVNIIPAGGSGYKSLEVASKNVTAYVHKTAIKKWDICAGNAILNALGGHMTDLHNVKIDYGSSKDVVNNNGLVATLINHDEIIEKLKPFINGS